MIKYIKLAPQLGMSFFMPYILTVVVVFYVVVSLFFGGGGGGGGGGVNIKTPKNTNINNDGFWDMITIITTSN